MLSVVMLWVIMLNVIRLWLVILNTIMLSVVMLNVILLNVIMLRVIMLWGRKIRYKRFLTKLNKSVMMMNQGKKRP